MAKVIRGDDRRVIPAEVVDARLEAAAIVERARADAANLREQAARDGAERARSEARAELAAAHLELARARERAIDEIREEAVPLAIAIAERILGAVVTLEPQHVRAIAEGALSRVRRAKTIRLRVHPLDAPSVEALGVTIVVDEQVARGGCVVESDIGTIDARIETQLAALARALEDRRQ